MVHKGIFLKEKNYFWPKKCVKTWVIWDNRNHSLQWRWATTLQWTVKGVALLPKNIERTEVQSFVSILLNTTMKAGGFRILISHKAYRECIFMLITMSHQSYIFCNQLQHTDTGEVVTCSLNTWSNSPKKVFEVRVVPGPCSLQLHRLLLQLYLYSSRYLLHNNTLHYRFEI